MNVAAFFHCYVDGRWEDAIGEYLAALEDSAFDGELHVGYVGQVPERLVRARHEFEVLRPVTSWWWSSVGWEQVTLNALHAYCQDHDGAVLYAHTKGATRHPGDMEDRWRRWMMMHVVLGWRHCAQAIEERGLDTIGCHYLTNAEFPRLIGIPMYGGNFWMATCEYVRTLPLPSPRVRHDAEGWIGLGNPRAGDLTPGWPNTPPYSENPMRCLRAADLEHSPSAQ